MSVHHYSLLNEYYGDSRSPAGSPTARRLGPSSSQSRSRSEGARLPTNETVGMARTTSSQYSSLFGLCLDPRNVATNHRLGRRGQESTAYIHSALEGTRNPSNISRPELISCATTRRSMIRHT